MIDLLSSQISEAHENVIKDVLRQIHKREPTEEDAKDISIFQKEGENEKVYVAWRNLKVGIIQYVFDEFKIGVEFIPFEFPDLGDPATNEDGTKVTF